MVSTAVSDWEEMDLLVLVKAYPSVSMTTERPCASPACGSTPRSPSGCALFPVGFRDLPAEQQFEKYDVITLRAQRHSADRRAKSYRPDLGSIRVGQHLAAGGHWPIRRRWVEPLLGPTMCELHRAPRAAATRRRWRSCGRAASSTVEAVPGLA